ncbi:DUF4124 domain-containing protein [Methyloversatilis discipulorum]|uniref:DUF4124 domain-containing protein n=1 Tax=Methyloversatilis discipulorum TaxID=1119528 RepID=UPI003AF6A07D
MKAAALYAALCMLPVTLFAGDTVHRWVDERGVVNYGDAPPEGRKSTPIRTVDPLTVTGSPPPARAATPPTPAGGVADRDAVQREVESALQRERASVARESAARQEAAMAEARRRCLEQRRVDCDDPALIEDTLYGVPPRIIRRHPPLYPPIARPPAPPPEPPVLMRKLP